MYRIKTMNKISPVGLNTFDSDRYLISDEHTDEHAILVRSAKLHDYDFPANLLAMTYPAKLTLFLLDALREIDRR